MATVVCPNYASELRIDLGSIRSNFRLLAKRIAPATCGAVVKSDAYGLGTDKVAPVLRDAGCRHFFVAQLSEAFALSDAIGPGSTIFILNGLDPGCEAVCADRQFVPVLNSVSQVGRWSALARTRGSALPAALQIDSGMSRLGLDAATVTSLASDPAFRDDIALRLIMTHLACADEQEHPANTAQFGRFQSLCALFPYGPASIADSAGAFLPESFHLDLVRSGIALYGVPPAETAEGLRPVVDLAARVLQIREVRRGEGVGYGHDHVTPGPCRLATIGVGYADGWPRHLSGTGAAWHQGRRLPIVGRVSMDSLTIDTSAVPPGALKEGDFVELVGTSQSLAAVAREAGTIAYEMLTRLGARHLRVYVDGDRTEMLVPGARR